MSGDSARRALLAFAVCGLLAACGGGAPDGATRAQRPNAAEPAEHDRGPPLEVDSPARSAVPPRDVAVSYSHGRMCAVRTDDGGRVWCWGPWYPRHRDSAPCGSEVEPRPVAGTEGTVELAGPGGRLCARTDEGVVRCWTADGGEPSDSIEAVDRVDGLPPSEQIAGSGLDYCSRGAEGEIRCWSEEGVFRSHPGVRGAIDLASACAVLRDGSIECWRPIDCASPYGDMPPVSTVVTGRGMGCGVARDGGVWCWGGCIDEWPRWPQPHRLGTVDPGSRLVFTHEHLCNLDPHATLRCYDLPGLREASAGWTLAYELQNVASVASTWHLTVYRDTRGVRSQETRI